MVLLLLTFCLLLLQLWESVIVLCIVVRYFMSILVLQSSWLRELIALLNLSSWCLVTVERLFLAVPRGCLQFVIVVFPDHTHLLFLGNMFHSYMQSIKVKICYFVQNVTYVTLMSGITSYR